MSTFWGTIAGDTPRDRAVRIAGTLAELGQTQLLLHKQGVPVPVFARVTDLPGMLLETLASEGLATLDAPQLGATCTLSADTAMWQAASPQAAALLRDALSMHNS
jgi:hypothetical protein